MKTCKRIQDDSMLNCQVVYVNHHAARGPVAYLTPIEPCSRFVDGYNTIPIKAISTVRWDTAHAKSVHACSKGSRIHSSSVADIISITILLVSEENQWSSSRICPFCGNHTGPYNYNKSNLEKRNRGIAKERKQMITRTLPQRGKGIPGREQGAANSYSHWWSRQHYWIEGKMAEHCERHIVSDTRFQNLSLGSTPLASERRNI